MLRIFSIYAYLLISTFCSQITFVPPMQLKMLLVSFVLDILCAALIIRLLWQRRGRFLRTLLTVAFAILWTAVLFADAVVRLA